MLTDGGLASRVAVGRRPGGRLMIGALCLLLLVGTTACAAESTAPTEPERPAATETPPSPAPGEQPSERRWERFSDPRFPQSFEVPSGWTVRERPSDPASSGPYQFDILDAEGEPQLFLATGVQGLGGACTQDLPVLAIEELDSETLDLQGYAPPSAGGAAVELVPPRFVFRASQLEDRVVTSLSVSDDVPVQSCMYYNLLRLEPGPMAFADAMQVDGSDPNPASPRAFASMDEARAFMASDQYATLKRVLLSLRLGS